MPLNHSKSVINFIGYVDNMKSIAMLFGLMLIFSGCSNSDCDDVWEDISEKVSNANYCNKDADCVAASDTCCWSLVNIKEKERVETFASEKINYNKDCLRICDCDIKPSVDEIKCENNTCIDTRYQ